MRLLLRLLLGQQLKWYFQRPNNSSWVLHVCPFCPLCRQHWLPIVRLLFKPHPSQTRLARLVVRLDEWKVVRKNTRKSFFALFAAISHVSTCHLCALIGASAEWQRQATTGEEEIGPVKTGVRFFFLVAKATPIKCLVSGPPPASIFENL